MIIDFHTHVFPDKIAEKTIRLLAQRSSLVPYTYGQKDQLLESMSEGGVNISVVLPVVTAPKQFDSINRFAEEMNVETNTENRRIIAFGGIHPDSVDYKSELDELKERGFKGIKLHPDYQGVMIDDDRNMKIIEYADQLDMIISVHAGIDVGLPNPVHCSPKAARRVIDAIHPKKLVLAHFGGWRQWNEVEEVLVGQNVYFDTAFTFKYIEQQQFIRILENHGSDMILFATDSPWGGQKQDVEALHSMPVSLEDKEKIFHKNAEILLDL